MSFQREEGPIPENPEFVGKIMYVHGRVMEGRQRAAAMKALGNPFVAFVIEDSQGEAQAIRDTFEQAEQAIVECENYYYDAETCGHIPGSGGSGQPVDPHDWVAKKRPFTIRPITADERDQILEEGTPVLDREP